MRLLQFTRSRVVEAQVGSMNMVGFGRYLFSSLELTVFWWFQIPWVTAQWSQNEFCSFEHTEEKICHKTYRIVGFKIITIYSI